ncbi:MAG: FecR domain-containing protein [Proteobacteria bacterium]|nr:FecR domain-containing protein [Pseudomonadota bacterium]
MSMKQQLWLAAGVAAGVLLWSNGPVVAQQAGVTSAVNPTAQGTPPSGQTRVLNLGANIARNERIQTSADGLTQVLFNDGSNLSIGPNADITIDEYTYNPSQGSGRMVMSLARGVIQLTGGRIPNSEPVTVNTPTGTIGIRGAVGIVSHIQGGQTKAAMVYGKEMSVRGQSGGPQTVNKPNYVILIAGPGLPASVPVFLTKQQLLEISGSLAPKSGSSGGASSPPSESSVQSSGGGLTQIVTTPTTESVSMTVVGVNPTNNTMLLSLAQSIAQSNATKQFAQDATASLTAAAFANQLFALINGDTLTILFSHINGTATSATGTVNGTSVTVSTANGQTFSSFLSGQSGNINVKFNSAGLTIPITLSTSAPTLRQMDDFPTSTQKLTTSFFGSTLLELLVNNSMKSIRATNVATGSINGISYRVELPAGSVFGKTPTTTSVKFFLNNQLIVSGNLGKLNIGFKP